MSAPVREYCTYFDGHYLPRAQALLASLRRHARPFRLHALCLDDAAFAGVCLEPDVVALRLRDLERERPELLKAKHDRSTAAYYFTLTPVLLADVLEREASIATLTYLDADLYFFASPEPLFEELGPGPLAVVEHRFPERLAHLAAWGRFNVGWLTFTRQPEAQRCLLRWREQCLEWCHDRIEGDRFADQKYLDEWPRLFPGTVVLRHPGAGLAPWNAAERELRLQDGRLTVDGAPLVYYHFHGLRDHRPFAFQSGLAEYDTPLSPALHWHVYQPYLRELAEHPPRRASVQRGPEAAPTPPAAGPVPGAGESALPIVIRGQSRRLVVRDRCRGDRGAAEQVFRDREYDLSRFVHHAALNRLAADVVRHGRVPLVVDAGAHIGASALQFLDQCPSAEVVALEPEADNHALLLRNTAGLPVHVIRAALGPVPGQAFVDDPGLDSWGFRVGPQGRAAVEVRSMAQLLDAFPAERFAPLVVKIDIEGGEKELFTGDTLWLARVPLVVVELHDWLLPGQGVSRPFLAAIAARDVDFVQAGENVFCFDNALLSPYRERPA